MTSLFGASYNKNIKNATTGKYERGYSGVFFNLRSSASNGTADSPPVPTFTHIGHRD
jgi:hypothetical protein